MSCGVVYERVSGHVVAQEVEFVGEVPARDHPAAARARAGHLVSQVPRVRVANVRPLTPRVRHCNRAILSASARRPRLHRATTYRSSPSRWPHPPRAPSPARRSWPRASCFASTGAGVHAPARSTVGRRLGSNLLVAPHLRPQMQSPIVFHCIATCLISLPLFVVVIPRSKLVAWLASHMPDTARYSRSPRLRTSLVYNIPNTRNGDRPRRI